MDVIALEIVSHWNQKPHKEYILLNFDPNDYTYSGFICLSGFEGTSGADQYLMEGIDGHGYRDHIIRDTYEIIEIKEH